MFPQKKESHTSLEFEVVVYNVISREFVAVLLLSLYVMNLKKYDY